MKKGFVFCLLAVLELVGCQTKELDYAPQQESKHFTATIEDNFNGSETKTYLDENGNVRWKQGDQVSIFAGSTVNEQWQVTDASDGKTSAGFNKVSGSGFVGGTDIDNNVAFYPYTSTAEIAKNGNAYVISDIILPATQNYAEASFGNGAFPMAAVTRDTDDMHLKFKNVLGGLKLQLKGTASIASISISGNQNEVLCGAALVTVSDGSTPSINLTDATAKTVTLDCDDGVQLNTDIATPFVIALPPMTMTGGFTVVVTDTNGGTMEIKTTKSQTITRSNLLKMPAVTYEGEGSQEITPLTFTSTGLTSISIIQYGSLDAFTLEYKVDDGEWSSYIVGNAIGLTDGQKVSFRAGDGGNASFSRNINDHYSFRVAGNGTIAASGSIMSLLNQEGGSTISIAGCFSFLFAGCKSLTTAPELPATTLAATCYYGMFSGCTGLTTAPELPATTLASNCYDSMFKGCTSLATAPELPATTLAISCYRFMFEGCTGLKTAPTLPATTLALSCYFFMFADCTGLTSAPVLSATTMAEGCYQGMFMGCTGLTSAPTLPATILDRKCYEGMFYGCTGLTSAPELPITTLADYCYQDMFAGCTGLTSAPELPATTMVVGCYSEMFHSCTGLTTAPTLPATTLANHCYQYMFVGCTGLTTAPELPATTLAEHCYDYMFYGCTNLNNIKALFTTTPSSSYTNNWVYGVAATGTFVKSSVATWTVTGNNGIPSGWTVLTDISKPEAVDLGLPSGIKWASFNVGASSPEEYGDYFAWGEIQTKTSYSWSNYLWYNGYYTRVNKYCPVAETEYWDGGGTPDGKTILDLEDDAARANWGGTWRMPTDEEWTELRECCLWEWTTYEGVKGYKVYGPESGKTIFLPAAGRIVSSYHDSPGVYGEYWSSLLEAGYSPGACFVSFDSDGVRRRHELRSCGFSVRPVTD